MKMKRNGLLALMLAALTAVCLLTACDNGNSDKDDGDAAGGGTITTLNGRTFVCESQTITIEYSSAQSDGNGGTYTKAISTLTNMYYITGTSDSTAKKYTCSGLGGSTYNSQDITYSINGNTITFTYSGGSNDTATITSGNSFSISGSSTTNSGTTMTASDQVFTEGDAPSSGSFTTSYQ